MALTNRRLIARAEAAARRPYADLIRQLEAENDRLRASLAEERQRNRALRELFDTSRPRCLGCGGPADEPGRPHRYITSTGQSARCDGHYQVARRVDYWAWLELAAGEDRGEQLWFEAWAEGRTVHGVPSYVG